ncbi:hypothetical protein ACK8P5_05430 [Paenibacillus sp. EC2-1]|uniref:hypothetical protein n=1 Tax=Paenibacillus sp. EC2-1 TaxID=3388665 RepID=UPI003BEF43CA
MRQLQKVKIEAPYYKLLNYDPLYVLGKLIQAKIVLIFLEAYYEEDIDDFLKNNRFTIMDEIIQIKKPNNVISYYPYIRSEIQLKNVLQNEDWGFSCVALTPNLQHLFDIRGIEEEGEMGIKIKEIQDGLYDRFINLH